MKKLDSIFILAIVGECLFFQKASASCELYSIDFVSGQLTQCGTSGYNVTCGSVSSSQWTVVNSSCILTTPQVNLNGTLGSSVSTPLMVEILNASSCTSCDDYVKIQYQINTGVWVTKDSVNACNMPPSVFTYNFNVQCKDTDKISVRVLMAVVDNGGGAPSEKLRIRDGGICVSTPIPILPIELISFTAESTEDKILLNWTTASEINNDFFTVEKSLNGNNFEPILTVDASENSFTILNYSIYAYHPEEGINYYRLKQTDENGNSQYSNIASADYVDTHIGLKIFPNPAETNDNINVEISGMKDKKVLVILYDATGKEIYSKVIIQESPSVLYNAIDAFYKLSSGIYLVTGSSDNRLYQEKLIIK